MEIPLHCRLVFNDCTSWNTITGYSSLTARLGTFHERTKQFSTLNILCIFPTETTVWQDTNRRERERERDHQQPLQCICCVSVSKQDAWQQVITEEERSRVEVYWVEMISGCHQVWFVIDFCCGKHVCNKMLFVKVSGLTTRIKPKMTETMCSPFYFYKDLIYFTATWKYLFDLRAFNGFQIRSLLRFAHWRNRFDYWTREH